MTHFSLLTKPATVNGGLLAVFLPLKDDLEFMIKLSKQNPHQTKKTLSTEVKMDPLANLKTSPKGRSCMAKKNPTQEQQL